MSLLPILKEKADSQAVRLSPVLARCFSNFFASNLRNPVFIIGCARSGTSLLARLCATHRDVAHWSEANQVWDPQWYPWRPANWGQWPLEFDPVAFTSRWWTNTQFCQQEIQATFGAYQWLWRRPLFLNKSPFNTFRIPYLLTMFPGARFIHMVRDGRAVVYSYSCRLRQTNKLHEWPEPQRTVFADSFDDLAIWLASFWRVCLEEVARQDEVLGLSEAGILLEVTYEALCADPSATLDHIWRYMGLDTARSTSAVKHKQMENQNHKWQERLNPDLVDRMVFAMEPMLTQKGYR